jgi:hypothetical protein
MHHPSLKSTPFGIANSPVRIDRTCDPYPTSRALLVDLAQATAVLTLNATFADIPWLNQRKPPPFQPSFLPCADWYPQHFFLSLHPLSQIRLHLRCCAQGRIQEGSRILFGFDLVKPWASVHLYLSGCLRLFRTKSATQYFQNAERSSSVAEVFTSCHTHCPLLAIF